MLRALIRNRIADAEQRYGYDMGYLRELLEIDLGAFGRFAKIQKISEYRRELPEHVWHAARLAATLREDCGPCAQLVATMAEQAGVPQEILRAVVRAEDARLPPEVLLGVRFVRAAMARDPEVDRLREQVVSRWGRRALVTLGFAMVAARTYPTLKYALGYGRACTRVAVGGEAVSVRAPSSTLGESAAHAE